MTQTRDLIKKMADFFKSEEYCEKGEDARLELSPEDVRCMNRLIHTINLVNSISEKSNKWILCSERLPEENGVYIISYEDAVTWLEWFNGKWFFYPSNPAIEETGTIIAWMPLPKPYKAERSNK